ncbi:tetratricopeptide repeat protein [Maribacter algicola]|uniref:Tetratricopeptide repeat protein n=1 Tax=Meishania litoralis TaxID=3434685 RepID=A0ACC7LJ02_9FLAO
MKKLTLFFLLVVGLSVSAQDINLFDGATKAYNEGDYEKAAENYLKILENGHHSAELYFNLGNCYYKLNQIAPSIYYYEKALLLRPNDSETKNNLTYAQNMTLDAIDKIPEAGLTKIKKDLTGFLSFDQWAKMAVAFMILFVMFYIAFYFFRYSSRKRIAFISSIVALVISIISTLFAYIQYDEFKADQPAIVFSEEIVVRSEPNDRSQEIFKLHEGAKVNILEELNDFKKVQIADGKTGWLPMESIKVLKDF